jgi:hypothetical protein
MNSSLGFLTPVEEEASALFPQFGLSTLRNQVSMVEEAGTKFQELLDKGSFMGREAWRD